MTTIVLVGGGSGGHITPILAVADELKRTNQNIKLVYVGQKGDPLARAASSSANIDESYLIQAGKFRRYHTEGILQIFDIPTLLKNARDFFRMLIGIRQSRGLLRKIKPDVIFTPGGFVGVPVGFAAKRLHIPFVTHDLDAVPGLANRINARHAAVHAVGMPKELYAYPPEKTEYVGVPVARDFQPVSQADQTNFRDKLGLSVYDPMLFVIGGGQGAQRLNQAVLSVSKTLLTHYPKLVIVHAVGGKNLETMENAYNQEVEGDSRQRVVVKGFIDDVFRYSGAADLIITRAGASNMAEFTAQHKACIVIPNPFLTGGHQPKNIRHLQEAEAIKVITEEQMESGGNQLLDQITILLDDAVQRQKLGARLGEFAMPNAASDIAKILLKISGQGK